MRPEVKVRKFRMNTRYVHKRSEGLRRSGRGKTLAFRYVLPRPRVEA